MNIRPVGDQYLRADGRTDMTKLIVAFNNSVRAPHINVFPHVHYVVGIMPHSHRYIVLIFISERSCYAWEGILNVCVYTCNCRVLTFWRRNFFFKF